MMEPGIGDSMEAGHIGGTPHRNLLRTNENCRDLSRRSGHVPSSSALVEKAHAPDPAYRPTGTACCDDLMAALRHTPHI
jgi:hypothetical protein